MVGLSACEESSTPSGIRGENDATGPTVTVTGIAAGQVVTGPITITVTARDTESTISSVNALVEYPDSGGTATLAQDVYAGDFDSYEATGSFTLDPAEFPGAVGAGCTLWVHAWDAADQHGFTTVVFTFGSP
jgi:hypothetical protein